MCTSSSGTSHHASGVQSFVQLLPSLTPLLPPNDVYAPMLCCWRRRANLYDDDEYYHVHYRRRNRRHASVTAFCLITASVLFLFVALSLPIIKSVYLLQLEGHPSSSQPATSVGTQLRFGVWGFCVTRSAHASTLFVFFVFCWFLPPARFSELTTFPQIPSPRPRPHHVH